VRAAAFLFTFLAVAACASGAPAAPSCVVSVDELCGCCLVAGHVECPSPDVDVPPDAAVLAFPFCK